MNFAVGTLMFRAAMRYPSLRTPGPWTRRMEATPIPTQLHVCAMLMGNLFLIALLRHLVDELALFCREQLLKNNNLIVSTRRGNWAGYCRNMSIVPTEVLQTEMSHTARCDRAIKDQTIATAAARAEKRC